MQNWCRWQAAWNAATQNAAEICKEKAMASDLRERNAAWWALVMGAAAALEDAANFLSDSDAKRAAEGAANHYRREANALWPNAVGKPHRWNDDGERCLDCGDKDWMADKYCSAAPVVQPDMVMVPREATEAMLDAAMNRHKHVSPEAKARYTQMHRENFRCDYKAMIAAAEWKSNAEGKPTPD